MCGSAPGIVKFEERVGTHMADRLTMRLYIRGKMIGEDLYLCPETVDFMIRHLTNMRKEFKSQCS